MKRFNNLQLQSAVPVISGTRRILRQRPDSEHELIVNRLALSGSAFSYLAGKAWCGSPEAASILQHHSLVFLAYALFSALIFLDLLLRPDVSPVRRIVGLCSDIGFLSYGLHVGDETLSALFPIYLWIIFGNGFRFGITYLFTAAGTSIAAFGLVAATTQFWATHISLTLGLGAGLCFLPLYVSTLIRKLSEAKQQAETANKAKGLFLASVSHELRTPLNAIIGFSDLLSSTSLTSDQLDLSEGIAVAGRRLLALISSILEFSRADATTAMPKSTQVDLVVFLCKLTKMLSLEAGRKGLRLSFYISSRTPRFVRTDCSRLEEVLMNLLSNAIRFTDRGFVVVSVDATNVHNGTANIRVEVTDTGIGIAPEAQERIFESFTQADETIIDRYGGTGLGLSIVRRLVESQRGQVGVESSPGNGSTFWFELPLTVANPSDCCGPSKTTIWVCGGFEAFEMLKKGGASDIKYISSASELPLLDHLAKDECRSVIIVDRVLEENELNELFCHADGGISKRLAVVLIEPESNGLLPARVKSHIVTSIRRPIHLSELLAAIDLASASITTAQVHAPAAKVVKSCRPLSVLVAEDNRTNQKVIERVLTRAGHVCTIVEDGVSALEILGDRKFDVVLLDINMPGMNGIEVAKLYGFSTLGRRKAPVIALTADATEQMKQKCNEAGICACVTKPVQPNYLIEVISEQVHRTAGAAPGLSRALPERPELTAAECVVPVPILDRSTLAALRSLGGPEFVTELAQQFVSEASELLRALEKAFASRDFASCKDRVHSLRSAAANVGATVMHNQLLKWRCMTDDEIIACGEAAIRTARAELKKVCDQLSSELKLELSEPGEENVIWLPGGQLTRPSGPPVLF